MDWLDEEIEKQKEQRKIIEKICEPYDPAELVEIADREGWD